MNNRIKSFFMIVMGFIVCGNVLAETAQDKAIKNGREHYKMFCINCHGVNADGKGSLIASLKITPSDLTALKQTGDMCIAERVLKAVSGMHNIPAGQEHKMPVFSGHLESITVYEISQYLKSIQK
jgi:mono/diheme cytochrome c family protein